MALFISGNGTRTAESYDGSSTDAPKLVITYSANGEVEPEPVPEPPLACNDIENITGSIDGVEPESISHLPVVTDANGNLYRLTESTKSDGNNPRMMKSTNNGKSWNEVDKSNRPDIRDLEGVYQTTDGTTIYYSINTGKRTWFVSFNMSAANSEKDKWNQEEEVADDYAKSSVQYSSLAKLENGDFWIFYSFVENDKQQIAYKRRIGENDYSSEKRLDGSDKSWTGPRALSVGNTVYVFYKDEDTDRLMMKTIFENGNRSDSVRLDNNNTSKVRVPHIHPQAYELNGEKIISIAYADRNDQLIQVNITDNKAGDNVPLTSQDVLQNPEIVRNEGTVATIAKTSDALYYAWTDDNTGDILYRKQDIASGSFSNTEIFWDSGTNIAWYLYCSVKIRNECPTLACSFDVGPHEDDVGDIIYLEKSL